MGNIDGLREQVEQLKQRLNEPESQQIAAPDELKTRLASIKKSLESKQGEIAQLSAEKQKLAAEKDKFAAELQRQSADKDKFAAELQRLSAENDQLRKMLKDLLSALDSRPADSATSILSEFLAETDSLIEPNGQGGGTVIAAGPPAAAAAAQPGKAESAGSPPADGVAQAAESQAGKQRAPDTAGEEPDEEESPALRRIMKRGRRAAG